MSWKIDSITIRKTSLATGEASVRYVDEDNNDLVLNKIVVDLNDGIGPVQPMKAQGTSLVTGNVFEGTKEIILDICQGPLANEPAGVFRCVAGEVERL